MAVTMNTPGVKIINIMADGSVREDLRGYLKSADQLPEDARRIIAHMIMRGYEIYAEKKAAEEAAAKAEQQADEKAALQSTAQAEE